jgi:integrase
VFATSTGRRKSPENVRNRVLAAAVKRANEDLEKRGEVPLAKLTPHSLRRTFASVLYAIGEPAPVVMAEMGHTDAGLALRIYAQAMRFSDDEKARLVALVNGEPAPDLGTRGHSSARERVEQDAPQPASTTEIGSSKL